MVTPELIREIAPKCSDAWSTELAHCMIVGEINTPAREAMFIAQMAHESQGFTVFVENLNYSADGLLATWPSRFKNRTQALAYARRPEQIASYVYACRNGNGDEASGDGWTFRGRGPPMLTGRENYAKAGDALHFPLTTLPDKAAEPDLGSAIAVWFWRSRGLNELSDEGDFVKVTKRINGGIIGLPDRERWLGIAHSVLNGGSP